MSGRDVSAARTAFKKYETRRETVVGGTVYECQNKKYLVKRIKDTKRTMPPKPANKPSLISTLRSPKKRAA